MGLDLDAWIEKVKRCEYLMEDELKQLCEYQVKEILVEESNVQAVNSPVTVCGDIHGQFHDLMKLFDTGGPVPSTNYIFMGDFVDRGYNSLEVFTVLMLLKARVLREGCRTRPAAAMGYSVGSWLVLRCHAILWLVAFRNSAAFCDSAALCDSVVSSPRSGFLALLCFPRRLPLPCTCLTTHSPMCHSPMCHSPMCHSPMCHSPTCHSPTCHSPTCHSPMCHSPMCHSPMCHSPMCHSPMCHSPTCHSPMCHSPMCHSPILAHVPATAAPCEHHGPLHVLPWPHRVTHQVYGYHSAVYGFYDECQRKYGNANAWRYCTDVFDFLGISAIIDGRVRCLPCHPPSHPPARGDGGAYVPSNALSCAPSPACIPPSDAPLHDLLDALSHIRVVERQCEIPHEGPFCDLMWSDPEDIETWAVSPRGAGWLFGARVTTEFNQINGLELVCRAHQLVQEGLKYIFDEHVVGGYEHVVGGWGTWWVGGARGGWVGHVVGGWGTWWVGGARGGWVGHVVGGWGTWWVGGARGGWVGHVVGGWGTWWVGEARGGWVGHVVGGWGTWWVGGARGGWVGHMVGGWGTWWVGGARGGWVGHVVGARCEVLHGDRGEQHHDGAARRRALLPLIQPLLSLSLSVQQPFCETDSRADQ
ncbi:unnamed protein product [Closterium sp. NIES-64]|nr:unnamed protein product [Closterium sp. NIES-64]